MIIDLEDIGAAVKAVSLGLVVYAYVGESVV